MDNLRLDIEWDVNEADLKASMDRSKKTIEGAGQSVEVVESKVNNSIANMARSQGLLDQSWQSLNIQAQSYARIAATSLDPAVVAKYNKMLHETQTQMARIKTMGMDLAPGATSRSGWNGLQNSINQISRELPAFTYSAQIGFMAISNNLPILADEIGRLKQQNDELVASGKKGVPIWRQVVSSLLSWHTALSLGITLITVYGKEIGEFIVNLFKGGEAARIAATKVQAMNKAFESAEYGKAIKDLAELRTVIKSAQDKVVTKERALQIYNDTVGKTAGQLQSFNDLEQWQIDNEKAYLQLMYRKAQAQAYLQVAVDKTVEAQKKALEGPSFGDYARAFVSGFGNNLDAGATLFNQLGVNDNFKMSGSMMKLFEEAQLAAQKFAKDNGLNFFADDKSLKSATAKILSSYKSLMGEIKSLDSEYARKVLPDDQAEMKALEDKFAKIREKIIEFNKSAGSKIKIDLEWLDGMQREARTNLLYAQASDKLAEQYKKDYELYKQYEEDKKSLGEEFANEAAGGNLTRIKSFYKSLGDEVDSLRAKITEGSATDLEKDRFYKLNPILVQMQDDDLDNLRSQYQEALKLSETFFTKEQAIRKKHQDAFAELEKNKSLISKQEYDERKNALKASMDDEIKTLIQNAPEFKKAMEAIDLSGRSMLADAFRNGKEIVYSLIEGLKTATNTEKARLKQIFGDFFDKGAEDATKETYKNIAQWLDGFGQLVEASFQFKDNLDGGLGTLSDMLTMAGKLAETFHEAFGDGLKDAGKGLSKAGGMASIIGAVFSVGSAISTGFNQARIQRNAEIQEQFDYQNERQLRSTEAITKALQQQLDLINEIYGNDRLEEYNKKLEEIQDNWGNINKELEGRYMMVGHQFTDDILSRLNNGESAKSILKSFGSFSNDWYQANNILGNLNQFERMRSLPEDINSAREELAKLQHQAALGNVDAHTEKLINQLQEQIDMYDNAFNKLREENTGNAFSAILNDVKSLFQNSGEDSAEAWSKGFSKILDNYIMQKFSRDYLEKAMQDWYTLMDEYASSGGGIDDAEQKALQQAWDKIRQDGEQRVKDIQNAMGYDPQSNSSVSQNIQGRINRGITETTGSEILGFERARYTLGEKTLKAIEFINSAWEQSLRHQAAIEHNTRDTADGMSEAVKELKLIVRNTNGANGRTSEGMGLWS